MVGVVFTVIIVVNLILVLTGQGPSTRPPADHIPQNNTGGLSDDSIIFPDQPRPGLPIRIKIPAIKVDASIERVGLTLQGTVGIPQNIINAAWFELGPRPGENGSAIIDGHFGWKNGIPGVFDKLHTLRTGDKVYIEDNRGATITFLVREQREYGLHDEAADVFITSDNQAHLNLITCQGVWNKTKQSYSDRLVVFTDQE